MRAVAASIAVGLMLALAGCSGDGGSDPSPSNSSSTSDASTDLLPTIEANAADSGSRPLLSWPAVDGAAEYHVTVFAADGSAHWSWSGTSTEVNVGGVADADGAGVFVFEPMTWVVMAAGAVGDVLGLSEPGALSP